MNRYLVVGGIVGTLLGLLIAVTGLSTILKASTAFDYALCVGIGVIVIALLLNTKLILKGQHTLLHILKPFWLLALAALFALSGECLYRKYAKGIIESPDVGPVIAVVLISLFITFILCAAPMYVSYVIDHFINPENDDPLEE